MTDTINRTADQKTFTIKLPGLPPATCDTPEGRRQSTVDTVKVYVLPPSPTLGCLFTFFLFSHCCVLCPFIDKAVVPARAPPPYGFTRGV